MIAELVCCQTQKEKHVSDLGLVLPGAPPATAQGRRKPTLHELAQLIREGQAAAIKFAGNAQFVASVAIERALMCGGYLRQAKARLAHGEFTRWVRSKCGLEPRTASRWMKLHLWFSTHGEDILKTKPQSLRQAYILAGILPEDETKPLPRDSRDELAKLRRMVTRLTKEAAAHRDYADSKKLWETLQPLAVLLRQVSTDVDGPKR